MYALIRAGGAGLSRILAARVSGPAVSLAIITFQLLGHNTKTGRQVEQREVRKEIRAHHLFACPAAVSALKKQQ